MTAPLQQGQVDRMCGPYSTLNFLTRSEGGDGGVLVSPADSMRYLFDASQRFGWLTSHYLTKGFEDFEVKAIIDLQITRYTMSFTTFYVGNVIRQLRTSLFDELVPAIANGNGFKIANVVNNPHGLLVKKVEGSLVTIASASARKPIKKFSPDVTLSLNLGMAMLLRPHQLSEIDI